MSMLTDFIGRDLCIGDLVAFEDPAGNGMTLAKIESVTTRMVICEPLTDNNSSKKNIMKYARQCVKMDQSDVTMYLLTRENKE